jgi:hypothetical protein
VLRDSFADLIFTCKVPLWRIGGGDWGEAKESWGVMSCWRLDWTSSYWESSKLVLDGEDRFSLLGEALEVLEFDDPLLWEGFESVRDLPRNDEELDCWLCFFELSW